MHAGLSTVGVTLDRRLCFDDHASAVARSCNYHARAIRRDVNSLLQTLLRLSVEQCINCKLTVLTFKSQQMSSPQYLSQQMSLLTRACNTRSSSFLVLRVLFRRTLLARRSHSTAAPLILNSLPPALLNCDSPLSYRGLKLTCFLLLLLLLDLPVPPESL